ncbi:MAG: hypothetical protein RIR86_49, partial [Acidobacteriota bacterium]
MAEISLDSGQDLLRANGLTKSFAGVEALRRATLSLRAGE